MNDAATLQKAMRSLTADEYTVILRRWLLSDKPVPRREVAAQMDWSEARVRYVERRAMRRLRRKVERLRAQ